MCVSVLVPDTEPEACPPGQGRMRASVVLTDGAGGTEPEVSLRYPPTDVKPESRATRYYGGK